MHSDVMDQNLTLLHCFPTTVVQQSQLFTDFFFFFQLAALGDITLWPQLPNASNQPLFGNNIQTEQAVVLKALSIA